MMWLIKERYKELWEHLREGPHLTGAGVREYFLDNVELGPGGKVGLGDGTEGEDRQKESQV